MPLTIGLLNHSGLVGQNILKSLQAHQAAEDLKIVIFHRSGSKSPYPSDIEARVLDLENGDAADLAKAVADIGIFISAIGGEQLSYQLALVDALSTNKDLITFIPSEFGMNWLHEDEEVDHLKSILKAKAGVVARAREKGVPVTLVQNGVFAEYIEKPFNAFGVGVKDNEIDQYGSNLENIFAVTSVPYLAESLVQRIIAEPSSLAGKKLYSLEYTPTGNELVKHLTEVHGQSPKINQWTDETYNTVVNQGAIPALGARIRYKWGRSGLQYDGERIEAKGYASAALGKRWQGYLSEA